MVDVKGDKYTGSKGKTNESMVAQLGGSGKLMTKEMKKVEVLKVVSSTVFSAQPGASQALEAVGRVWPWGQSITFAIGSQGLLKQTGHTQVHGPKWGSPVGAKGNSSFFGLEDLWSSFPNSFLFCNFNNFSQ